MILAFVQAILITAVVLYEYKRGSIGVFLWAMLLLNFAIPHLFTVFTGAEIYSQNTYLEASLFVIVFTTLYLLTKYILDRLRNSAKDCFMSIQLDIKADALKTRADHRQEDRFMTYSFLILLLFFGIFIIDTLLTNGSLLDTTWGSYYLNSSNVYDAELSWSFFSVWVKYVCFAFGGLCYSCAKRGRWRMAVVLAIIIGMILLLTRNRILVLPLVVSLILFYLVKNRQLRIKQIVTFSIIAFVVIYVVYALRTFRHAGTFDMFLSEYGSIGEFNAAVFDDILNSDGELWLRNIFYYFIENDNNFPNFNEGHTYLRLLLILVPTRFAGGLKPPDFAISMASAWYRDYSNTTYSVHPTLFGDCYANFNWFGMFLGVFWAIFVAGLNRFLSKQPVIVRECLICLYGVMFIIIGRGSVYNSCVIGLYGTIIVFLSSFLSRLSLTRELRLVYVRSSRRS